jgi:hypothetical protein
LRAFGAHVVWLPPDTLTQELADAIIVRQGLLPDTDRGRMSAAGVADTQRRLLVGHRAESQKNRCAFLDTTKCSRFP